MFVQKQLMSFLQQALLTTTWTQMDRKRMRLRQPSDSVPHCLMIVMMNEALEHPSCMLIPCFLEYDVQGGTALLARVGRWLLT